MVRWHVRGNCVVGLCLSCEKGKVEGEKQIGIDGCNFRCTRVATMVRVRAINYT